MWHCYLMKVVAIIVLSFSLSLSLSTLTHLLPSFTMQSLGQVLLLMAHLAATNSSPGQRLKLLAPLVTTTLNHWTLLPLHLAVANILPERTQTAECNKSNTPQLDSTCHLVDKTMGKFVGQTINLASNNQSFYSTHTRGGHRIPL